MGGAWRPGQLRYEAYMSPSVEGSFAEQERASLQPLAPMLTSILAQPLPTATEWPVGSAFSARERADLIARISVAQQNAAAAVRAFTSDARDADEAGRKAAAWGITSTVTAAIIAAIVAVITSVFTFGSGLGSAVAILAAQTTALGIAAKNGHPLAGELAAILALMADSLRGLARADEQHRRESILVLGTDLERALATLARLPRRAGSITGGCSGDRTAAFETCRALDASLARCAALLERVPRGHMDTRPAVEHVIALREAVASAVRTLAHG
jgi:hypothetical protein